MLDAEHKNIYVLTGKSPLGPTVNGQLFLGEW